MTPPLPNDHECNAWCTENTHTHLVLIHPRYTTEAAILTNVAPGYRRLRGRTIRAARRATEVDTAHLRQAALGRIGVTRLGRPWQPTPATLATMQAWLITYTEDAS